MKIIAIINQKGGTGKTTTSLNVGAAIARHGKKVLLVDAAAQGNLTTSAGLQVAETDVTLYEVLKGSAPIGAAVRRVHDAYDLVPTDIRLSAADMELAGVPGREFLLQEALSPLRDRYDYVVIDCPPSLSIIPLMALAAASDVIIPVQAQYLPLNGLSQLLDTIDLVRRRINRELKIGGVILTMYDGRKNLASEVMESVRQKFPDELFATTIPENVALAEAPAAGQDIFAYAPNSKGAAAYAALTDEILKRMEAEHE